MAESENQTIGDPTKLLVSVRSVDEAQLVLEHGVDILDLKEPNNGALGAVDSEVLDDVSALVQKAPAGKRPLISFAAGELVDRDFDQFPGLVNRYSSELVARFQFVKIGLAGTASDGSWPARWRRLFDELPKSTQPVAVGYFDRLESDSPSIDQIVKEAIAHPRVKTVLLDTFQKDGDLFRWIDDQELAKIIATCHSNGLSVVIAGSVKNETLDRVKPLRPNYVGVRGAICSGGRSSTVSASRLIDFKRKLTESHFEKISTAKLPGN